MSCPRKESQGQGNWSRDFRAGMGDLPKEAQRPVWQARKEAGRTGDRVTALV